MILKEIEYKDSNTEYDWEEVPQEELWEDGELNQHQVGTKILHHVMKEGNWKLIRRTK
tara:strand:+ start:1775 stop:1948 length:174 start_codon:yes stop_codon:yes gene_type:complete